MKSQCVKILEYMRKHGSITAKEAYEHISCMRLASRIDDLKRMEYDITKKEESYLNGDGRLVRYARYSLCEAPEVKANVYDQEEIHSNCTVQILTNSQTGDVSIGWWENEQRENN